MKIPGIKKISDVLWQIPTSYKGGMRVPVQIYASEKLVNQMEKQVFEQITNVACLPGIVNYAFCLPDGHTGYGFPIGGAAAFDPKTGIISPGGIGFDINCGMRLLKTSLTYEQVKPKLSKIVDTLFARIPSGVGGSGAISVKQDEFCNLIEQGMDWCLRNGYADKKDLDRTEERGCMKGAKAAAVSHKAIERGYKQVGSLGSGNHYLEIQVLKPENIHNRKAAEVFGLDVPNQIVIMVHCGSRGFGHQIAQDYLFSFLSTMQKDYHIKTNDKQLACVPFMSKEGQDYFSAMQCAVNMAFVNRQIIIHKVREVFSDIFKKAVDDLGMEQIYDVTHNTAKLEIHTVQGKKKELLLHRKGATRAFGPGMEGIPAEFREVGQPVIIGGSMETGSYLLTGTAEGGKTFYTTAHGSGRVMGRHQAKKQFNGRELLQKLKAKGIYIRCASYSGLAEEAGAAYKNIDDVVEAAEKAGLSRRVARLIPIGNIKG
jgi:tRNA-splicing ligase RtcB